MALYPSLYGGLYGPLYGGGAAVVARTPILTDRSSALAALLDQYLDPISLDYVDTDDGEWLETPDSRTLVMIQIEMALGRSYSAPGDGTRTRELLEAGDPVTPELVAVEVTRAMGLLEQAGVIADFSIAIKDAAGDYLVDANGRLTPELHWLDLATSTPVDLVFAPFQGS